MHRFGQVSKAVAGIAALIRAIGIAFLSTASDNSLAQPPPTKTAIIIGTDTPTITPTITPTPSTTPTPSPTPTPTDTGTPTDTPAPTATGTTTHTPTPTHTLTPTSTPSNQASRTPPVRPTETSTPKPTRTPKPQPGCQSIVEGYVLNAAGQRVAGATVRIAASGWSNQMLADSDGHYGFGGLCGASYTLQATLPGGQTTQTAAATVDGQNSVRLDLRVSAAASPTAIQPGLTSEPGMPTTGFSGWLLAAGVALGILLLLLAGARRALGSRQD